MPLPSAAEMNPSDGALSVFGRVLFASLALMAFVGVTTMVMLTAPAPLADIGDAALLGLAFGLFAAMLVAPVSAFVAAALRHTARESLRKALMIAAAIWAAWTLIGAALLGLRAGFDLTVWSNIWPFLPGTAIALAGALWLGRLVHRSVEPLTAQELRKLAKR